ncbi:helix-turn-helix domain-containing protein [Streptomyces sp. NPDC004610]|uniref:TetR/AcrR family transcriptional regulator n=1 Tax=unclassified Streptomyces TaxID=2593676 RepID=UPI0033A94E54
MTEQAEQTEQAEGRPRNPGRKAAARNRAALVAAAREIFTEHGLDAPLSVIARRAGVGQGVLYRHFPDRESLAIAVLEENVRHIEVAADAKGATLAGVLGVLTWHLTESAGFLTLLHSKETGTRSGVLAYAHAVQDRVRHALGRHLTGGDGGRLGTLDDVMLAVIMVAGAVRSSTREEREERALAAWRLLGVTVGPPPVPPCC